MRAVVTREPESAGPAGGDAVESSGPWPFVTRRTHRRADGTLGVWQSRQHRKGLSGVPAAALARGLWMPRRLNWWIGAVFALGSALFVLGSVLILSPALATAWSLGSNAINAVFFAGSIPFTAAAYLQLFQAANAGAAGDPASPEVAPRRYFGWRPGDIGWLASALQLAGTILFNLNTFDAMIPGLDWLQADFEVWVPDLAGSVLFLVSGHLAFAEAGHAHLSWRPASLSWWITLVNLLGCVAFMISALLAFTLPPGAGAGLVTVSVAFTLAGAAAFLLGSLLMLPETAIGEGDGGS